MNIMNLTQSLLANYFDPAVALCTSNILDEISSWKRRAFTCEFVGNEDMSTELRIENLQKWG
jgi:hypothetical protein